MYRGVNDFIKSLAHPLENVLKASSLNWSYCFFDKAVVCVGLCGSVANLNLLASIHSAPARSPA